MTFIIFIHCYKTEILTYMVYTAVLLWITLVDKLEMRLSCLLRDNILLIPKKRKKTRQLLQQISPKNQTTRVTNQYQLISNIFKLHSNEILIVSMNPYEQNFDKFHLWNTITKEYSLSIAWQNSTGKYNWTKNYLIASTWNSRSLHQ